MMENAQVMKIVERIEVKIDDIRDKIHEMDIMTSGTQIRLMAQEEEIRALKSEVINLKTAHDKAAGAYKLAMAPGVVSLLYAVSQLFVK